MQAVGFCVDDACLVERVDRAVDQPRVGRSAEGPLDVIVVRVRPELLVIVGIAFAAQGKEAVVVVVVALIVGVVVGLVMSTEHLLPGSAGRVRRPAPTARPAP